LVYIVIVIINSRFLERPQKQSRETQLIQRRLTRKNLHACSGQNPAIQTAMVDGVYGRFVPGRFVSLSLKNCISLFLRSWIYEIILG